MEIVTFAEIQKVKWSFEFKNSISSIQNCNEFRFFEPRFASLNTMHNYYSGRKPSIGLRVSVIFMVRISIRVMVRIAIFCSFNRFLPL